jgi:hydroxyacylglutathione hydrolase
MPSAADGGWLRPKIQNLFAVDTFAAHARRVVIERAPLEDELGDVLDKALLRAGLTAEQLAEGAAVDAGRVRDVIDYRGSFTAEELNRIAVVLRLNPAGLAAVAGGRYPLPEIRGLPFCLYPLRTPHGIGVANGYIVADCARDAGLLFDCGADADVLRRVWPSRITNLHAVFLTHHETEHVGGLPEIRRRFPQVTVFGPRGVSGGGIIEPQDGSTLSFDGLEVRAWQTPGHVEGHFCYVVTAQRTGSRAPLLISGDLLFAGSIGGSYFCAQRLAKSLQRVLGELPGDTVVAPGHGPLTTIKNERAFNPFVC